MKTKEQTDETVKPAIWRQPIKMPTLAAKNPIDQLYRPTQESALPVAAKPKTTAQQQSAPTETKRRAPRQPKLGGEQAQETLAAVNPDSRNATASAVSTADESESQTTIRTDNAGATVHPATTVAPESKPVRVEQRRALVVLERLLRTESIERLYSLQEVLRGTSMTLYCILYLESRPAGRCQMRAGELMMRAGISNPATLHKQERWLTQLGLVSKNFRLGSHDGAVYEVAELETLPLPAHILQQFDGYLAKHRI